jgi:KUP system potassium uptake protein
VTGHSTTIEQQAAPHGAAILPLTLGALGIVYGDIGTSPLYAFREAFHHHELEVSHDGVIGACSLVFWALTLVIAVKYLALVMKADNRGEGGILALTSLLMKSVPTRLLTVLTAMGIFGTALLYGDGMITPAISVLSAVEGVEYATSALSDWVIPIAIAILTGLFLVQKRGTAGIGKVFGPIMVVWFGVLALLGLVHIGDNPEILQALNPLRAAWFFTEYGMHGVWALGSIFLVVTGGEALYADMGHFGRKPITVGWWGLVFPALALNYMGQGAILLEDPANIEHPFFNLAPGWAIWPLVLLATMATVIASQALISGAFSLTTQAMRLDYLPRVKVTHTSSHHQGQVYVPIVNWILAAACIGLVLGFRTSSNLAAAYGIAVTMTMAITTLLYMGVAIHRWNWSKARAFSLGLPLLGIDLAFLFAQVIKIPHGGWFALLVGVIQFTLMTTWRTGRSIVSEQIKTGQTSVGEFVQLLPDNDWVRVAGTAAFLFKNGGAVPPALLENLRHNRVLHEKVLLISVDTADFPTVPPEERVTISKVGPGIWQVLLTFGFMDDPNVPEALELIDDPRLPLDVDAITFFLGRETVLATAERGMNPLREQLFALQNRSASSAARFFSLPSRAVFEVGTTIEI